MGIAVLSGVLASLNNSTVQPNPEKWESHTPGTLTPTGHHIADETLPSRYLACVSRQESAKKLQGIFYDLGGLGPSVEVLVGENVRAAQEADVILLWYAIDHE